MALTSHAHEEITRATVDSLTDQITSLINPENDNMLAPWMTALEKAEQLVEALKATCNGIASRPIMNPGQQGLRAIAALPDIDYFDVASPELDAAFDAIESQALADAAKAQEAEAERIHNAHVDPFFQPGNVMDGVLDLVRPRHLQKEA